MRKQCRRKVYRLVDPIAHAIAGAAITTDDCLQQLKDKEQKAIEAIPDCMLAEIELKQAAKRFESTGKMLLTGSGLKAINEVSEWHHLQRTSISRSEYERMIQKTRNKLKSKSKDVTVIQ